MSPATTSSPRRHPVARNTAFHHSARAGLGRASVRSHQESTDNFIPRSVRKDPGQEPSGLDFGAVLRSVWDFNSPKASSAAAAAGTGAAAVTSAAFARPAAAAAAEAATAAAAAPPPGPFAAAQMSAAASGAQPMAALAEQVLTGHGAVQDDPVAAARQLQAFLAQYKAQYGPDTDARINAAVAKLQDYIEGYSPGQDGLEGVASSVGGAVAEGQGAVYHNYILEQLTGVLDWVNGLLVNNNPKPYMFDAYGRVLQNPDAATSVEQQQEQLRAASNSLRMLIQQLQQVNRQYAAMADPDEKAAMGQVLSQLTTMADRLAVAATRRPLPPAPLPAADAAASAVDAVVPYVRPQELYGVDKYRDPLLRVLDGVYQAVVVDSGLREFLTGIKQLGDSLVASMTVAWTGAPPIGRLIAYIAAVAGVLFVMRTRLPPSLLAPTNNFLGQLGQGLGQPLGIGTGQGQGQGSSAGGSGTTASGGGSDSSGAPTAVNPAAAAAFATISQNSNGSGNGSAAAAATAAAFAAIAARGGGAGNGSTSDPAGGQYSTSLIALDMDAGLGDTRLPSEIFASNDPYSSSRVVSTDAVAADTAAGGSSGGAAARRSGGYGNGWATLTGGAAAPATASSSGPGLFTSPSFPGTAGAGPRRGAADGSDWWGPAQPQLAAQVTPSQMQASPTATAAAAPPPPPPSPAPSAPPPAPRSTTVAESWEAYRRIQDASGGGGGMLDTTAALAAAAVAAAAYGGGSSAGDPKMAEVARAVEERRLSKDRARLRATIKDRLRWVCLALGPVSSVVPGGEPLRDEVDGLLAQLEALSPTDKPLNTVVDVARRPTVAAPIPLVDPLLLGDWRLVYASNASATAGSPSAALLPAAAPLLAAAAAAASSSSTSITPSSASTPQSQAAGGGPNLLAQILHIADSLPGFGMTHVVQRISVEEVVVTAAAAAAAGRAGRAGGAGAGAAAGGGGPATLLTENSAVFRFGPLGSWRVAVRGRWTDNGGGLCATAEFESFSVRPVDLWGLPVEQLLPEVMVPVPDILRSRSEWCTTYLDDEMRIGRSSGGALFLFRRGAVETEPAQAGAQATAVAAPPPAPPPPPPPAPPRAPGPAGGGIPQPVMRPL